jgi:hypothetical protein
MSHKQFVQGRYLRDHEHLALYAILNHPLASRPCKQESTVEVDVDHGLEILKRIVLRRRPASNSSVSNTSQSQ